MNYTYVPEPDNIREVEFSLEGDSENDLESQ